MVCLRLPPHVSFPHSGLDLDRFPLRGAQYKVHTPSVRHKRAYYTTVHLTNVSVHRLCVNKHDEREAAEAKAKAVIDEDYRKLGPIK